MLYSLKASVKADYQEYFGTNDLDLLSSSNPICGGISYTKSSVTPTGLSYVWETDLGYLYLT